MTRHFLTLNDLTEQELKGIIKRASQLRQPRRHEKSLEGRVLAMIFEQPSTRTRVSFEAGMYQLGGYALYIPFENSQLGRNESIQDTAKVLSRMVDVIMMRTTSHTYLEEFKEASSIPVINGLSDLYHPCQLLSDMMTYIEHRGDIVGKKVAWLGDGNNMCHSYINAAGIFDFELIIACPDTHKPSPAILATATEKVSIVHRAEEAVTGADLVVTDVWESMGQAREKQSLDVFMPFQVNQKLLSLASQDVLFMHCLPAHRGEEVSAEIIDGKQSVVWDEAENRLHAQKALLEFLLLEDKQSAFAT